VQASTGQAVAANPTYWLQLPGTLGTELIYRQGYFIQPAGTALSISTDNITYTAMPTGPGAWNQANYAGIVHSDKFDLSQLYVQGNSGDTLDFWYVA
jgi:hypothetical protein